MGQGFEHSSLRPAWGRAPRGTGHPGDRAAAVAAGKLSAQGRRSPQPSRRGFGQRGGSASGLMIASQRREARGQSHSQCHTRNVTTWQCRDSAMQVGCSNQPNRRPPLSPHGANLRAGQRGARLAVEAAERGDVGRGGRDVEHFPADAIIIAPVMCPRVVTALDAGDGEQSGALGWIERR